MMPNEPLKFPDTAGSIVGCTMRVRSWFGMGFPGVVCRRSLCIELEKAGLRYQPEVERAIHYQGRFIGKRRPDLLVEGCVWVELKAVPDIDQKAISQTLNYL